MTNNWMTVTDKTLKRLADFERLRLKNRNLRKAIKGLERAIFRLKAEKGDLRGALELERENHTWQGGAR